eukprot:TRINITY_DN11483_c0_g1_i4.p1 TRINITY_DN11483_c0_g1~~TRINITY_DN11483_c0_g1_i4.p1  ORF type:complete len:130 (-),score=14.58 TRINITY_DN11483_c0_g1_i4:1092-1481(-)
MGCSCPNPKITIPRLVKDAALNLLDSWSKIKCVRIPTISLSKISRSVQRAALFHPSALILGPQSHALGFGKTNGSRSFQTSREIRRLLDVLLSRTHGVMQEKLQSNKPPQIPSTQSWFLKACFCAPSPM